MATIEVSRQKDLISVESLAYMRPIDIEFTAVDCKPNCRLYATFDNIEVNQFIVPNTGPNAGILGGDLYADKSGNANGIFRVPAMSFNTGIKSFVLTENPTPLSTAINGSLYGYCVADFQSTGIKEIYQTTIKVRTPPPPPPPLQTRSYDPLAQSFFTDGFEGGVFVTGIDLYFWSKDESIPVRVELREMVNGYPGPVLSNPNASASLAPEFVKISEDGSIPTRFIFENPLYLPEDKDYCFVVLANSQNYNIFTCTMGERAFENDLIVFEQPYLGSLFKSQNNQTWTAEQYEDIKFTIYRAKFDTSMKGEVVLSTSSPLVMISPDCLSTTTGSNVIRAELTFDHNLELGSKVGVFFDNMGVWNGIPASKISGIFSVTSILGRRAFEYVITQNATSTGKIIHGGFVKDVYVTNKGLGYDSLNPPTITFSNPPLGGVTATASPVIKDGKIVKINVTNNGSGYIEQPTVTITGSVGIGATAIASMDTTVFIHVNRSYSMVTPAIGNVVLANTKLDAFYDYARGNYEGGNITSYTPSETIKFNLSSKNWLSENAWLCSTSNEKAMFMNNHSSKFTLKMESTKDNVSPVISLRSIRAMFSGNLINNQTGEDILSENPSSFIEDITIVNGGIGYTIAPEINFVNQYGCPGTGAAATATISGGTVSSITITNPGSGYLKQPYITFDGAATVQATAKIDMAPFNSELRPESGTARSRYISKIVTLSNSAESARLYVEAYSGHQSNFDVYLRTSLKADGLDHKKQQWTLMKCGVTTNQSSRDQEFMEYEFTLDELPKYDTADIKIVFRATQPIDVPALANYRAILTV